jgi:hypothetical protein
VLHCALLPLPSLPSHTQVARLLLLFSLAGLSVPLEHVFFVLPHWASETATQLVPFQKYPPLQVIAQLG